MTNHNVLTMLTIPLSDRSLAEAATLTSHAFRNTPSYQEIVPDPELRSGFLLWLFERNLWLRTGSDSARCVFDKKAGSSGAGGGGGGGAEEQEKPEEQELVMFFMLEKPGLKQLTTWDMLRAGLLSGFFVHGVPAMRRMVESKDWFQAREREVLGARAGTVARLERVAVLPSRQGQGVGSSILATALKEMDELGLAVFLATQEERNVVFYRRLGFEVIADEVCPIGGSYRSWMMLREPKPA